MCADLDIAGCVSDGQVLLVGYGVILTLTLQVMALY